MGAEGQVHPCKGDEDLSCTHNSSKEAELESGEEADCEAEGLPARGRRQKGRAKGVAQATGPGDTPRRGLHPGGN